MFQVQVLNEYSNEEKITFTYHLLQIEKCVTRYLNKILHYINIFSILNFICQKSTADQLSLMRIVYNDILNHVLVLYGGSYCSIIL